MKKVLLATAMLAAACAPAMARCHGHSDGEHWVLNIDSWTTQELLEVGDVVKKLKNINSSNAADVGQVSSMIDQMECTGVVTHEKAVKAVIEVAEFTAKLSKITPQQMDDFAAELGRKFPLGDAN